MKNETCKPVRLLIPALITAFLLIALIPSFRASADTIMLSNSKVYLYTNGGRKKIHLYLYDDGVPVKASWKSSKKKVATVSSSGVVKAKKKGTTTITATYQGIRFQCKIKVRKKSSVYKKAIKAYNKFLKNPYVTYTSKGARAQADNFRTIDLDRDGVPELLVNVVTSAGNRYHVLYHYNGSRMSTGQQLGICADFVWYSSPRVLFYKKLESKQTLSVYSRDNGITLNSFGIIVTKKSKSTYYKSNGDMDNYGTKVSALEFRNYVDHDVMNYAASKQIELYLNTPYNRSRFLK